MLSEHLAFEHEQEKKVARRNMANYGYGYGNYTSQPQQYNASYGYASTPQPATRVVQGYQQASTAYGTGYAQAQAPVQAVPAASTGGYGYFQRAASDQSQGGGYNQKSNYSSSQGNFELSFFMGPHPYFYSNFHFHEKHSLDHGCFSGTSSKKSEIFSVC